MSTRYNAVILRLSMGVVSLAVSLALWGQNAPTETRSTVATSDKGPLTAEQFIKDAVSCGNKEVQFSELALRKTTNPEIRQFAQKIITDHTKANAELKQIASRQGITLPPEENKQQKDQVNDNLASRAEKPGDARRPSTTDLSQTAGKEGAMPSWKQLEQASGAEFDRLYVEAMLKDHEEAIRKFEAAAQRLDDSTVKQFASSSLVTLREHQNTARKLSGSTGQPTTTTAPTPK